MDDRESPTNDLQLNLQELPHTDTHVEKIKKCLASSPDENENQFNRSKHDALNSRDNKMGKVEQDSINNNEDRGDYTSCCREDESDKLSRSFTADEMLPVEKYASEKRNPRKTQNFSSEDKREKTVIATAAPAYDEDINKMNANSSQNDPNQTLQALFSLLREEFEQMDSRLLPLYLHQIAETYFQAGEYEKAMKFIQLERLYHEQLLANLSSIQQQWEKKWKTTELSEAPDLKNSAKGLNNEELDKLAELCTSHQEPLLSKSKLISKEKSLRHESLIGLMVTEDLKERNTAANDSDTQTWSGIGPKEENHHKESERRESFQSRSHYMLQERAGHRLAVEKDLMEKAHRIAESTQDPPTRSTGKLSTPHSGCLSFRDASEDDGRQLREEQFSEDVAEIEAAAEEPAAECSSKPMVDTLIVTDAGNIPPDLISTDENVLSERNFLRSASHQLESSILSKQQQPDYENDRNSDQGKTSDISRDGCAESSIPEKACATREGIQKEATVLEEECESEGPEDLFDRFLNGSVKDREESPKSLESQRDSEIATHILPDQALYSSSDGFSLDESFSSLDELAKRIEIAETVPTEGLVSILKKRDDTEGKAFAQIQQRQSKRRVRFQEMDDTLDQEEVGGGSCILLILLCIATVFLSIGGTALYCTFGDAKSPVCTEFATNVDFYYTRILQGIEELKHWISFS
ncbi:consortin [Sceloporus undulatus]|uniref:consortin n=1 Tax=Sceloporus undulatus TaxID=8520 RepID=UPI001C4B88AC|nr:consortin [Sceloporus undulatus]XP_042301598.1 consortin [Sceloporus undulatus]